MDRGRTQTEQQDQTAWGINAPRRSPIVQVDETAGLIQISDYMNENPRIDRKLLKRNLDLAERKMRKTADGKVIFLYPRTQLDEIAKAA